MSAFEVASYFWKGFFFDEMHGESKYEFRQVKDEVEIVVQKAISKVIDGQEYDHIKVRNFWSSYSCVHITTQKICVYKGKRLHSKRVESMH